MQGQSCEHANTSVSLTEMVRQVRGADGEDFLKHGKCFELSCKLKGQAWSGPPAWKRFEHAVFLPARARGSLGTRDACFGICTAPVRGVSRGWVSGGAGRGGTSTMEPGQRIRSFEHKAPVRSDVAKSMPCRDLSKASLGTSTELRVIPTLSV